MSEFWRRWLIMAAGITGVAGLAFAGLAAFGAIGVLNTILDTLYLPGELAAPAGEAALFAIGVMGAVTAGWATMMLILLGDSNETLRPAVWRAFTVGLLAWFFADGIVTAAVGAPGSLVLNAVLLALYAPVCRGWGECASRSCGDTRLTWSEPVRASCREAIWW